MANTGCGGGTCHGSSATSTTNVNIVLDSAGTIVTHYKPGVTYRVTLLGKNTSAAALHKFGFQLSSSKAASVAQAGTWLATSLPTGAAINSSGGFSPFNVVSHSTPKNDSVVTSVSYYPVSVNWTAPAAGTGSVKFYGVINAVDGDNAATSGDKWNTGTSTITELPSNVGINDVSAKMELSAFPNPVSANLTLQLNNAQAGSYNVRVFNINGQMVATQNIEVSSNTAVSIVDMRGFATGMYQVAVEKDGIVAMQSVIKK